MTIILISAVCAFVAVCLALFYIFPMVRSWFNDSETILLNRLTMFAGLMVGGADLLVAIDPYMFTPFVGERWVPFVLVFWGLMGEVLRRYRAKDLK